MTNLIDDLSVLCDVSDKTLRKFISKINYCIGHAVHEDECKREEITIIDLGYGELHIKHEQTSIRYKFIPSKELENTLIETVISKRSPMITKLENDLQEKIDRTYKELL